MANVTRSRDLYVEDWAAGYGTPYLMDDEDDDEPSAILVEDGTQFEIHDGVDSDPARALAFVDGVRRGEAALYRTDPDGSMHRAIVGAYACGAVLCDGVAVPRIIEARVQRLVIWEGNEAPGLPDVAGGWSWTPRRARATGPDAPLGELQNRMREAESILAQDLCRAGHSVVMDGPIYFVGASDHDVMGYVKTHRKPILAPEYRVRVPEIGVGQRTSLFTIRGRNRDEKYACYARIGRRSEDSGPWSGIIRIEFPLFESLARVVRLADTMTARLVRYAGVAHRDPRAPQNLQPIGALEKHLRHLLGDGGLAERAVREAVRIARRGEAIV